MRVAVVSGWDALGGGLGHRRYQRPDHLCVTEEGVQAEGGADLAQEEIRGAPGR